MQSDLVIKFKTGNNYRQLLFLIYIKTGGTKMNNDYDPLFYPFYGNLSDNEKKLYQQVLVGINIVKDVIKPTTKINADEVNNVIKAIIYDRPELFWFSGNCAYAMLRDVVTAIKPEYNGLAKNLKSHQRLLDKSVEEYIKMVKGKEPHEQERLIHDQMVKTISYEFVGFHQTAYADLVEHKAVCAGYTRAFQPLMQKLGTPCYYCSGTAIGMEDNEWSRHAWNILKLGDDFYNLDITWNDCYDKAAKNHISYIYYNCTDLKIMDNHRRAEKHAFLPICSGEKYSFDNLYGIQPELEVIYQDGVTCKTPVTNKLEFLKVMTSELKGKKGKTIEISFPAKGDKVKDNIVDWFKEAFSTVYSNRGCKMDCTTTDYKNGWYKLKYTIKMM